MPARVLDGPLGIACVFSDGRRVRRLLGEVAGPQLARDLMSGLAQLVHPHGTVDADGTLGGYVTAARHLVTTLAGRGFTGGAGQLTRAMLVEYWMGVAFKYEACTRRMLRGFDTATGGLDIRVRELTAGNAFHPQLRSQPLGPYRETEWARLASTCRTIVDDAYASHRQALGDAGRGHVTRFPTGSRGTRVPGRAGLPALRQAPQFAPRKPGQRPSAAKQGLAGQATAGTGVSAASAVKRPAHSW